MNIKTASIGIDALYKELEPYGAIKNAPMRSFTTFRIGGNADILLTPEDRDGLMVAINAARRFDVPFFIMGAGSNLLVSDSGLRGLVIRLCSASSSQISFEKKDGCVFATIPSGMMLSRASRILCEEGLSGLEWAYGIPGTIGGAAAMNAGAYGGEIKQSLVSVTELKNGEIIKTVPEDCDMGYRRSVFAFPNSIVLEATFRLTPDNRDLIAERLEHYMAQRRAKQPLDLPSAGSVFKRPEGHYAGALIEAAGLKGVSVGGAQVSPLHAGFIVNTGGASARDVMGLIALIKKRVYESSGVMLEEELKTVGEF